MPSGGALRQGVCHAPQPEAGKLGTLGANGRVCEGKPQEAQDDVQLLAVNPTSTYQVTGAINGFFGELHARYGSSRHPAAKGCVG